MNIDDFVIMSLIKKLFNTETFKEAGTVFWKKLHIMCLKTVIFIAFCFFVIVNATEVASISVHESLEVMYERLLAKLQKNRETLTNALKLVDRKKRSVPSKYNFFDFFFLKCPWNISVLVLIFVYSKIKIYL